MFLIEHWLGLVRIIQLNCVCDLLRSQTPFLVLKWYEFLGWETRVVHSAEEGFM